MVMLIFGARWNDNHQRRIARKRLIRAGRVILPDLAIREAGEGRGIIVRNHSSLPGEWWFVVYDCAHDDGPFYHAMVSDGLLIEPVDSFAQARLEAFPGREELEADPLT